MNEKITLLSKGTKTLLAIFPAFVCASLIAGYIQVFLLETVIQGWLGTESGLKGIAVGYLAGFAIFGGPFVSFPVAASLYQAGASVATVTTFITSWAIRESPIEQLLTPLSRFTSVLLKRQTAWPGLVDPATGLLFCEIQCQKKLS